ncbi:MAG: hypothetical protein DDT19_02488 [Syntrophomonadaceae bacterium]|nr:hypothetical protein [Bacillota bacterium]
MLCTLKIKLVPNTEQFNALLETMKRFNQACNQVSQTAFETKTFGQIALHKLCYYDIRKTLGLSAQMAVRTTGKVSESYRTDRKTLHTFKETGAMVFDSRILSFKNMETASILTLQGRIRVPMVVSQYHEGLLCGRRVRGQADLILQKGVFYLLLVVDVPEGKPNSDNGFIGVDLGIVNIAVDSTGEVFSGATVNGLRKRHIKLRKKLQAKGTKSAKKLLRKRSKKEKLFARDVNHCISKKLVEKAKGTRSGIALENLKGIRDRVTVRKAQRTQHSSWSFYQLRQFVEYKSAIVGVPIVLIDPRNTSRECPTCGHIDKKNRLTRNAFCCRVCGCAGLADNIAAVNIGRRANVNLPNVGVVKTTYKPLALAMG